MVTFPITPPPTPTFSVRGIPVYGDTILAPMDGYSDWPFRSLCRSLGSAMSYTEFVSVNDIEYRPDYVAEKLAYTPAERPLVMQLYGDKPEQILRVALQVRKLNPDIIDINMGCPAKTVSHRGAGVGLMRTPSKIAKIFSTLTAELDIPVTGKMRLGWDDDTRNFIEIAQIVQENGGALLAVHGRTKRQGFHGQADWDAIAQVVQVLTIPVIGNGDVRTLADIQRIKAETGCAGVMIGRAAMHNPWIFSGLDRDQVPPAQVQATMLQHLELSTSFYGPERGLVLFRKYASRYLIPYRLAREPRTELLTCTQPEDFVRLLDSIIAHQPPEIEQTII